jgi:Mg-chelatase subunit ChlD
MNYWLPLAILFGLAPAACGGSSKDDLALHPRSGSGTGGTGAVINLGGNVGGSGPSGSGASSQGATSPGGPSCASADFDGCVGELYEGEALTLDIYVMFDQSGSMASDVGGMTRMQAVERAAQSFLSDPKSASIGVGIGYFGFQPVGQVSCDTATYATPDVGVTLDHAQVVSSLDARMPLGETPTAAAIDGACTYATSWRRQNPTHSVVILLMTDGIPEAPASCASGGCCPQLGDAVQAASDCARGGVRTYVLGVGPELGNLNQIAAAGGTDTAYLVGNQDVSTNVLSALNSIRGAAIPCDLDIPPANPGQPLDFSQVNVLVGNTDCSVPLSPVYYVTDETQCDAGAGGWFYDDPSAPTHVKLCGATCAQVSQPDATLRFSVGCQSLPPPVR